MMLEDRSVIEVNGRDGLILLEKLSTNTIGLGITYSCILTPNGRFLYDFFVHNNDKIYIDIHNSQAEGFIKLLTKYRFKMNCSFDITSKLFVMWDETSETDPRKISFGRKISNIVGNKIADLYHKSRIKKGIAEGFYDLTQERSIILEYGFDVLCGLSFTKGCYLGQELISRTKHTGQIRKRVFKVSGDAIPPKGEALFQNNIECGKMLSSIDDYGLALLRFSDIDVSKHLTYNDTQIQINGSYFT